MKIISNWTGSGTLALAVGSVLLATACGKGLNGTYVKCVQISSVASKRATYIIPDNTNFSYQATVYTTSDCTGTPNPQPSSLGNYATSDTGLEGAKNIDMEFNDGPLAGTTLYQIYKIDGNDLLLGEVSGVNNGTTVEKRPTTFEATPYFKQ